MRNLNKLSNSQETKKIRKILNEEVRLGISPNSDSETEEVDLQKELYPLGHYMNNREEMIEQMFSIIKGAKLKKMLPPILKDMPVDELKADCLIHLLGMSKKRIRAILEGRDINSSSDSESHSDGSTPNKNSKVDLKPFLIKQEGCSDISDNSEEVVLVDPDLDLLNVTGNKTKAKVETNEEKKKSKRKLKRKDLDKKHKRIKNKVIEEDESEDEVQKLDSSAESASENDTETEAPKEGKTLLEILELEMRARAIRALLKNNDPQECEEVQEVQKAIDDVLNPNSVTSKEKSNKKDDTSEKITPAKNFRKKKRKCDDVIVIAPKVVTIDLTDESEQPAGKKTKGGNTEDNAPSSSRIISLDDEPQSIRTNETPQSNNEGEQSSATVNITVSNENNVKTVTEMTAPCFDETSSKGESSNKDDKSEHSKSSWAQRWLESKEVKKVVSTSKICGNIRKKIKSAKLAKQQKPMEDESRQSPPPAEKEIEGSVVEYELLSKTKTNVIGVDNDSQERTISANQESTLSETYLTETSTADQVQDISSTRIENNFTSPLQDSMPELQANEKEILNTSTESKENDISETVTEAVNTTVHSEETGVIATAEEVEISDDRTSSQANVTNIVNENICSTMKDGLILVAHNQSLAESKEVIEECKTFSQNKKYSDFDSGLEKINTEPLCKSNDTDECSGSPSIDEINTLENESECHSLLTEKNESETIDNMKVDKPMKSNICETSKSAVSCAKPTPEVNEPETLEINITDEDRDIEDAFEEITDQDRPTTINDNIIVID